MGKQIVENARMQREEALRAEDRNWALEDQQRQRDWNLQDQATQRGYANEDYQRGIDREDASSGRAADALRGVYGTDLLGLIDAHEGGGNYDTLFGHSQQDGGPFSGVSVSNMTLQEIYEFSDPSGRYGQWVGRNNPAGATVATPMGRYQIVGSTLRQAAREMGLPPDTVFSPEVQDQIAAHLAEKRLQSASTMEGKRAALRNEWAGFRNVSDADLDAAIRQYEGGENAFAAVADPNVPNDVRTAVATGLGIGTPPAAEYTNIDWVISADGKTRTRMGMRNGRMEAVLGPDGQPITEPVTSSSANADLKVSDQNIRRLERIPALQAPGRGGEPPAADPELVVAVSDEILRLMQEEGLSETQAYNKAILGMVFSSEETRPATSGYFGTGIGAQAARTQQVFKGEFNYGGTAGTEPTTQAQPLPTNRDDLVTGQVYTFRRDGQTITARFDGTNLVAME